MKSGKKLSGRYKVKRPIGTGGMANVYEAYDLILNRDVAVKILRYDFRNDEDTIRRFKREALAATELVHPNIVSIYDVDEEENNQYIVMEYVKGMDLKQYIQKSYPIAYPKVIKIMKQILSAVEYAHQNQVIHRDLKPQNILIDDNGKVKITDFGIAVAVSQSSITQTNSLLGSVHYLSPEQARGGMATKQSDIYSLGIILYELLIGKVPFEGESAVSIALKHFQESIPSVKKIDYLIPQPLENVVLKATAKNTNSRYRTVEEMAVDLETALSSKRSNEEIFTPTNIDEETKLLTPINPEPSLHVKQEKNDIPVIPANKLGKEKMPSSKKQKKKGKKFKLFLILIAVVFFLSLLFIWVTPKDISVPDVSELTEEKARSILTESDLTIREIRSEPNEEIKEDLVIRTDPGKG
ncbi:MAG: Stk1 family PASTA domain-containing Ser/Thr kinase, partial [Pisciglobus halotolerans]|nr:Stk1 family PASTA domain-containing Ser/Thr kinase [Pisciglobus halotolerans]